MDIFTMLQPYLLTFIPLFIAIDPVGLLPFFISISEGASKKKRQQLLVKSLCTAIAIAILFMFVGKVIFIIMGITVSDFKIAGGVLLLILSVNLLLPGERKKHNITDDFGIVPLGTPMITGPAVLTTSLVMIDAYGLIPTLVSFAANMVIVWFVLNYSNFIIRLMGVNGTRAFSKVIDIFLAAIAVMMIRSGIIDIMSNLSL